MGHENMEHGGNVFPESLSWPAFGHLIYLCLINYCFGFHFVPAH